MAVKCHPILNLSNWRTLFALLFLFGAAQTLIADEQNPDAPSPVSSTSATSNLGFKKFGSFLASRVLGVDIPVSGDKTAQSSTPSVERHSPDSPSTPPALSSPSPSKHSKHTPTPAEADAEGKYAIWMMNWWGAVEGMKTGQTDLAYVPANTGEQETFDAACMKGRNEFYGMILANDPKSKAEYGKYAKGDDWQSLLAPFKTSDPLPWCHAAIEAIRDAKQVSSIARTKGSDAAAVRIQRIEWTHFDALAQAHHATINAKGRYPSNDQEQVALNAAARQGQKACFDWIDPTHDHAIYGQETFSTVGPKSIEEQCNEMARLGKYNDF